MSTGKNRIVYDGSDGEPDKNIAGSTPELPSLQQEQVPYWAWQSQLAYEAYTCASQQTQEPDEQKQQHVEAEQQQQQHIEAEQQQQQQHVEPPAEKKTRKRGRSAAAAKPKRKPRRSTPAGEKRARRNATSVSHRPACIDLLEPSPRVLLRRVFFLNTAKSKYLSVGCYPARFYENMIEFGGANLIPVILNEQRLTLLSEHLAELCEAMCRSEPYTFRDGKFRLLYGGGDQAVARLCLDKRFVIYRLGKLKYLMKILHIVQELVGSFTVTCNDVRSYAASASGYTDFVEPCPLSSTDIPYVRLFNELKTPLI
jgi:hypothetical protein